MIDKKEYPASLEDTSVEVNPYEITDKIWSLIESYFTDKYNVEVTEMYPRSEVNKPTIVAKIQRRTPGRESSKIHGKGANFVKFLKKTADGFVHELHVQQQELVLEYTVFATSTAEVKRIAWDLERAIIEAIGVLQDQISGFQMYFEQQIQDSSFMWRQQDELIQRTLRFRVLLPVQFVKVVPELRFIDIVETWGPVNISGSVLTRTSSDKTFTLDVRAGQKPVAVKNIFVKASTHPYYWEALIQGTDFFVRRDGNHSLYVEWNDDFGRTPSVGAEFRVDYELAQLMRQNSIKPQ